MRNLPNIVTIFVVLTTLVACDSESASNAIAETGTTPVEDTTAVDDTTPVDDTIADSVAQSDTTDPNAIVLPSVRPTVTETVSTTIGGWSLNPGRESTRCVVKRLSNADVAWVSQVRTKLAPGSHHLIVYKSTETEEQTEAFDCDPFVETLKENTFPLMITQIREETLTFPNGVAFRFEPRQMVRIEAHYLNYFEDKIDAHADIHFDMIAADDVAEEANILFYGNPDINVPRGRASDSGWGFIPVDEGVHVFAATGHTHAYGTNVEIHYAVSPEDEGQSIYPRETEFLWDEPPVEYYDPPVVFGADDGLRYRCSWYNDGPSSVGFGESANEEMCFLWAYYYPSDGYRICMNTGSYRAIAESYNLEVGDHVCCPGHFLCGLISSAF